MQDVTWLAAVKVHEVEQEGMKAHVAACLGRLLHLTMHEVLVKQILIDIIQFSTALPTDLRP